MRPCRGQPCKPWREFRERKTEAAEIYGLLAARYRARGQAPGQSDTMIAAIALAHGADIATRNLSDFRESGVRLHDPFAGPS